jgi:hypothetical protein
MTLSPIHRSFDRRTRQLLAGLAAIALISAIVVLLLRPGGGGWHVFAFAVMPDIALLFGMSPAMAKGQLRPQAVPLYNALHHPAGPALLAIASIWLGTPWTLGALAWATHIAVDRAVGYGLRDRDGFVRG